MTKFKGKLVLMALLMMAFTVSTVHAQNSTWEVEQIESGPDDGFIIETGTKFFDTPWVQIKSTTTSLTSYFAFRGVFIPENATILSATLQFTAPGPTTFGLNGTLDVTIHGIKTGDLTSWNPTPDLEIEPFTNALVNWDATPLSHGVSINVTVTDLVIEIYELYSWTPGNDMGFRVLSVFEDSILAARYQVAYDSDPADSIKLYIEYLESNSTYIFYKGYTIIGSTVGTGAVFSWNNDDQVEYNILTANGTDYKSVVIRSSTLSLMPDAMVSIGETIYAVNVFVGSPYNSSLFKTLDRGDTWEKVADLNPNPAVSEYQIATLTYDESDSIYCTYVRGFDTYRKVYTISNNSISSELKIYDGAFSSGEHRTYWDDSREALWISGYGGTIPSSTRVPRVMRFDNGTWETYTWNGISADARQIDVIKSDGVIFSTIWDAASDVYKLYELTDNANISSWSLLGSVGSSTTRGFDLGTYQSRPVIAAEQAFSGRDYIFSHRWTGFWSSNMFNLTGPQFFIPHEFTSPKMYYQGNGSLFMAVIFTNSNPGGEGGIMYDTWVYFQGLRDVSTINDMIPSTLGVANLGGDSYPFTAGSSVFTVYDENGTLIGEFDTLEDAEAAIDGEPGVGQTPDNPNPPGTVWPEEGEEFGVLTRFNMRFVMWGVGWFLIIAPLIIMAVKSWPLKIYLIFLICMALGVALQWSIGSV